MPQSPFRSLADLPFPIGLPKVRVPLQPIFDGPKDEAPTPNSTPIHTPDRVGSPAPQTSEEPGAKPLAADLIQVPHPALSLTSALLAPSPPPSPSAAKVMRGFVFMPLLPSSPSCDAPPTAGSTPSSPNSDAPELSGPSDSFTHSSSDASESIDVQSAQSDPSDPECLKKMGKLDITDSCAREAPPEPMSVPVDEPPEKLPSSPPFQNQTQRNAILPLSPIARTASPIPTPSRNRFVTSAASTPLAFPSRGSGSCSPVMGGSRRMTASPNIVGACHSRPVA